MPHSARRSPTRQARELERGRVLRKNGRRALRRRVQSPPQRRRCVRDRACREWTPLCGNHLPETPKQHAPRATLSACMASTLHCVPLSRVFAHNAHLPHFLQSAGTSGQPQQRPVSATAPAKTRYVSPYAASVLRTASNGPRPDSRGRPERARRDPCSCTLAHHSQRSRRYQPASCAAVEASCPTGGPPCAVPPAKHLWGGGTTRGSQRLASSPI